MPNINNLVINEMIGIRIRPAEAHEAGPNAKVETRNLGTPQQYEKPHEEAQDPDFYKNFPGNKLPAEKPDLNVPTDLATGSDAGERLRKAIQSHQAANK